MLIRSPTRRSGLSIELTPLIDVVFLLLIFFLVATTFRQAEREMQVALPYASSSGPLSAALREIIINVDRDGSIVVGGRTLTADALDVLIRNAVEANPNQKVSVRGDRAAAYGKIARVLDICKAAGIQEPYLDTVPKQ